MPLDRRQFLKLGAGAGALAVIPGVVIADTFGDSEPAFAANLAGASYASKFVAALPLPARIDLTGTTTTATITATSFAKQILTGYGATTLYGYNGQYPGPTIVTSANKTATVTFKNGLPTGSVTLANGGHLLPVDKTQLPQD